MSETKHSPEPWRVSRDDDATGPYGFDVLDAAGLMRVWHTGEPDARRIVACMNACAGIPTEALEAGALAKALDAATAYRVAEVTWANLYGWPDKRKRCDAEKDRAQKAWRECEDALRALGRLK